MKINVIGISCVFIFLVANCAMANNNICGMSLDNINNAIDRKDYSPVIDTIRNCLTSGIGDIDYKSKKLLAEIYVKRGRLSMEQGRVNDALADFDNAIEINPNSAEFQTYHGIASCAAEEQDSQQDLDRARLLNKYFDYSSSSYNDPRDHVAYQEMNYVDMRTKFLNAVENDPKDAEGYFNLAIVYHRKGKYKLAIRNYSKAIEFKPHFQDAFVERGRAFSRNHCYPQAIKDFECALAINPRDFKAAMDLANVYYLQAIVDLTLKNKDRAKVNFSKAIINHNKVIKSDPKNFSAWIDQASAYFQMGQYDRATYNYSVAILAHCYDFNAFFGRAKAYVKTGNFDKALKDLSIAEKIASSSLEPYYTRGQLYQSLNRSDEAIQDFTTAINNYPKGTFNIYGTWADVFRRRGIAYMKKGDKNKAREDFEMYLQYLPYADDREEVERFLRDISSME